VFTTVRGGDGGDAVTLNLALDRASAVREK
jgi:hypothetical protein